jgi:hypothetical protein
MPIADGITINGIQIVDFIASLLRQNAMSIAVAIVTTTIAIYGSRISKTVKKITHKMNVVIRFAVYVLVYAFAIGFLSTHTVRFITKMLTQLNNVWLIAATCLIFSLLIFLATDEKQI